MSGLKNSQALCDMFCVGSLTYTELWYESLGLDFRSASIVLSGELESCSISLYHHG